MKVLKPLQAFLGRAPSPLARPAGAQQVPCRPHRPRKQWRGLHTVGVRDFLAAINGIGHAAVACDPQFQAALAAHGSTVDATGEIQEHKTHVLPRSENVALIRVTHGDRLRRRVLVEEAAPRSPAQPGAGHPKTHGLRTETPSKGSPEPPTEVNPQVRGVETRGIEPLTPALQRRCSAN